MCTVRTVVHDVLCMSAFQSSIFFFNDTATTEIYTLSLHDALPICRQSGDFRPDLTLEVDTILTRALLDGLYELAADTPEQASRIASTGTRTILAALR